MRYYDGIIIPATIVKYSDYQNHDNYKTKFGELKYTNPINIIVSFALQYNIYFSPYYFTRLIKTLKFGYVSQFIY